jgi:hypothetical protein
LFIISDLDSSRTMSENLHNGTGVVRPLAAPIGSCIGEERPCHHDAGGKEVRSCQPGEKRKLSNVEDEAKGKNLL